MIIPSLFWHRFLAGTARWESRLRAGGTAGFCFVRPLTATLRVCGSPKKQIEERSFLAPPQKGSPWHWRAGPTRPFRAPRETGAEKEKEQMIEQIKQTNRGQFNVEGSLQVRTGDAPTGAERKPMVSWAALLDEAVKKSGFIHEAYSRFHNYSLGNQLLALFQCFTRGSRRPRKSPLRLSS
jgi:hypothetical protein